MPIVDKQPPKGRPNLSLPALSGLSAPDCSLADRCLDSNTILYLYSTPSSTSSSKDTARQQVCSPRALATRGLTGDPVVANPDLRHPLSGLRDPTATRSPRPARRSQHAATRSAQPHWRDLLCASARHIYSARLLGTSARHVCVARLMGELLAKICLPHLLSATARHICSPQLLSTIAAAAAHAAAHAAALAATRADRDRPTRRPADTEG